MKEMNKTQKILHIVLGLAFAIYVIASIETIRHDVKTMKAEIDGLYNVTDWHEEEEAMFLFDEDDVHEETTQATE